ncbi:hypothetical protein C823_002270 [Eubacterium plexicaudatum ASF492]|uniref:Magnesium transporter MgtE intracellular domain-containing protein n=1 Tax=Eubacterium plexicaudatum ASF492 TaxID=1235802 RepID=N2BBD9_9FIRM|nr:hypothetical protein C823_002270 [Eubacterium plexicaudatum ASF492]
MPEEAMESQADAKKQEKARKKEEKKKKKQEKKAAKQDQEMAEEQETVGGKLIVAFATLVIIAIWLGILALLIRLDVGGFGSTVLYPMLKDVPYVNKILPEVKPEGNGEDADYPYQTLEEAITRIKELEGELEVALQSDKDSSAKVEDLQSQVRKLKKYRDNEAAFESIRQQFYEEVVFGEDAPDITEYQKFYEAINPDNAEVLYKEVVEQTEYDSKVDDYVKTYSSMKPKDAAAIFDTMTDNLSLVRRILEKMSSANRANILSSMNQDTAAKLTEMLEPSKR